jgi:galactitol-specific phosphotransferase system IIB component
MKEKIPLMKVEEELIKNGIEVVDQKNFYKVIQKANDILKEIFDQKDIVIETTIVRLELFVKVGRFFVIELLFDSTGRLREIYSRFFVMFRESSDIFCTIFIPSEDFYKSFNSSPEPYFYTLDKIENILEKHGLKLNVSLLGVEFTLPFDVKVKEYLI